MPTGEAPSVGEPDDVGARPLLGSTLGSALGELLGPASRSRFSGTFSGTFSAIFAFFGFGFLGSAFGGFSPSSCNHNAMCA